VQPIGASEDLECRPGQRVDRPGNALPGNAGQNGQFPNHLLSRLPNFGSSGHQSSQPRTAVEDCPPAVKFAGPAGGPSLGTNLGQVGFVVPDGANRAVCVDEEAAHSGI